ncbi:MAG TPA: LamG domain-containing protein, partial [Verrucomicrobiae bacterium]
SGILASADPVTVGARKQNATASYNYPFLGTMNDLAGYEYALSADQVRQHYTAAGVAPFLALMPPATATASEGGTLTLPALTVGTPPLTNTWVDATHGTNLAVITTTTTNTIDGTLVVPVPQGWNGGALQLTAANAYGSTNVTVILTVISGAPVFVQNLPPAVTAVAGKPYTYSVVMTGNEPFTYQWYSNNVLLTDQAGPSYTFNAASGSYRVVVSNQFGTTNSTTSALTAVAQPAAPYAAAVLAMGPVGYWPLQETSAPAPVAMETNHGTLGAIGDAFYALGNVTFAQPGALTDGDLSAATTGATTSFAFVPRKSADLTLRPPLTLECWMQPLGGSATADLISQGGSGLNSAANSGNFGGIRMSFGGGSGDGDTLQFFAYIGSGGTFNGGGTNIQTPRASITRSAWNHCVATYDGTNVLLYINGTQRASGVTTIALDTWSPLTLGGGRWQSWAPTRRFNGGLDEVAIYTNVLSPGQIASHYSAGTTAGNYRQLVISEKPLLYYRMNCAGYNAPDPQTFPVALNYGSAAPSAAYASGVVPGSVAGPALAGMAPAVAAPINGIVSGVDAGYDEAFNPTGTQPFTAMTWFRCYPSDGVIQTIMSHGANWTMDLDGTTGRVAWNLGAGGVVTSSTILNDGNWHFLAGTYDGLATSLYVDGALDGSVSGPATLVGDTTSTVVLGGNALYKTVGSNERYFAGALAHAAICTNALSGAQIMQLYNGGAVPTISLVLSGNELVITYTGTLVSSTNAAGPYTPEPGATPSPYRVTPTESQKFYRAGSP